MKKEAKEYEFLETGTWRAIESVANSLETVTNNLTKHLSSIGAKDFPEYKAALEGIRTYAEAVRKRVKELNETIKE